mmetsp:Transcript_1177/g.1430  ORF Transcript_1177/g.1430 Transcript_1177/m.1430 type:complete len:242 (-) Transcript_1177:327-1052(-)
MRSLISVTITKERQSDKSGLYLFKDNEGRIVINDVDNGGKFANTALRSSLEIVSVNEIPCDNMSDEFLTEIIDGSVGDVTIVAREVIYEAVVVEEDIVVTTISNEDPNPSAPPRPFANESASPPLPPPVVSLTSDSFDTVTSIESSLSTGIIPTIITSNPPKHCPDGGYWGQVNYNGCKTRALCVAGCVVGYFFFPLCVLGLCAFRCPKDYERVYIVDCKVYDVNGVYKGKQEDFNIVVGL